MKRRETKTRAVTLDNQRQASANQNSKAKTCTIPRKTRANKDWFWLYF